MRLVLFAFVLCLGTLVWGGTLFNAFCPNGVSDMFDCMDQLVDANHDGKLEEAEIDAALASAQNYTQVLNGMTGAGWIAACDYDGSGFLNMTDWDNHLNMPNNTCLPSMNWCAMVCLVCSKNGWTPSTNK